MGSYDYIYICIFCLSLLVWLMLISLAISVAVDAIVNLIAIRKFKARPKQYFMRDVK
jgi:hypothetical protein